MGVRYTTHPPAPSQREGEQAPLTGRSTLASGDDTQLMFKIAEKKNEKIGRKRSGATGVVFLGRKKL